ncbi:Pectic acid lyase [Posidoniimonas corsicana]|uniref:Pectic acid lyase n=1 Tax=Posidoniimonas corsicana TaxID=1938618 RepID=A0A5C5V1B4_9BACT|nr:pectate lyase [Posidoniimonas corsicana]TWT32356.1 Pectic acid lyase [Posidoniimonas corsicana]
MRWPHSVCTRVALALLLFLQLTNIAVAEPPSRAQTLAAIKSAARYFRGTHALHGGCVYHYSLDTQQRWGEGPAGESLVWVEPPSTPSVGLAMLRAFRATGDKFYLDAARETAGAMVNGQMATGGWPRAFDIAGRMRGEPFSGARDRTEGRSSLDDGQTQTAIRFMARADQAFGFADKPVHDASRRALAALLTAQFPNGAFPQVWSGPVEPHPVVPAGYPDYDWRTEHRVKEYWDLYTLNDNVCGYAAQALAAAHEVYGEPDYEAALRKLGDFLILAQMPAPQRGWAQQYNYQMRPVWARAFEPPAIASDETQEAIETLLLIHRVTGDDKYLAPIPAALDYLESSVLPDGRLSRYYELRTNRPLYMQRNGRQYTLTYNDDRLPSHYAWKIPSRLESLRKKHERAASGDGPPQPNPAALAERARRVIGELDDQGRWVSVNSGGRHKGQPEFAAGERYVSSGAFCENIGVLCDYLQAM